MTATRATLARQTKRTAATAKATSSASMPTASPVLTVTTPAEQNVAPPPKKRKTIPTHTRAGPTLLPATLSFDLSTAISHLTSHDPRFIPLFSHLPCRPFVPPYEPIDPFKTLVTSIIGQQVSWMAARAINGRFKGLWGCSEEGFPTAEEVSEGKVEVLKGAGLSTRKAEYVIALAQHFVSGQLTTELLRDGTDEEVSKALIAVRGIGQWTVDMFLIFSLRRPDILPVGDLGVQKGLLRWALSAHDALPKAKPKAKTAKGKKVDKVNKDGKGEIDTLVKDNKEVTPPPVDLGIPPTPMTPSTKPEPAVLHTPTATNSQADPALPPTPSSPIPTQTLETPATLPPPTPEFFLTPPDHPKWDQHRAAPLGEELSVAVLKSRLDGKKVKGGMYLTPKEMEVLTEGWKPYRSLGVIYTWSVAEDL